MTDIKAWDRASVYDWTKFEKELAEDNIEISEKQKRELLKPFNDRKRKWSAPPSSRD